MERLVTKIVLIVGVQSVFFSCALAARPTAYMCRELKADINEPGTIRDCKVNFSDFSVMAGGWQDSFDISALALLCEEWLWIAGWNLDNGIGGEGAYFAGASCETGGEMMMMQSESLTTESFNVEETIKWLDEIWQSDKEISESISEKDWQEFIESVKNSQ